MKILALESSAAACSAALCEDEFLLAQSFQNSGLTHSRTLMPMVQSMLEHCGHTLAEVDVVAVAAGPGSFTGLRIGVSAAKGLAWPDEKPCAACSTLESMAWCLAHTGMELCAVMDARCGQVYNALFRSEGGALHRLTEDRALPIKELEGELWPHGREVLLLGDGAALCHQAFSMWGARLAPEGVRYQRDSSVALLGEQAAKEGKTVSAGELAPVYLRLPQAERELKKRQAEQANG